MNSLSIQLDKIKLKDPYKRTYLPQPAIDFLKLTKAQRRSFIEPYLKPFTQPVTVFIFLPEYCITGVFTTKYGVIITCDDLEALTTTGGMKRMQNTTDKKYTWSHLLDKKSTTTFK